MMNPDLHIFKIEDSDLDPTGPSAGDLIGYSVGWYFEDETQGLNGPFNSRQEALDSFNKYCEMYLGT